MDVHYQRQRHEARFQLRLRLQLRLGRGRRRTHPGARIFGALRRSYLQFSVSQDSAQPERSWARRSSPSSTCTRSTRCATTTTTRSRSEKEMQGATRHFPCHVFWSQLTSSPSAGTPIWGRSHGRRSASRRRCIAMLEAQRAERAEYAAADATSAEWQLGVRAQGARVQDERKSESLADGARGCAPRLARRVAPERIPPAHGREARSPPTQTHRQHRAPHRPAQ